MKKYVLLVFLGFISQITFAQNKELATKNQIIRLLDASKAKGIVFISNNDCISCVSYITATFKPSYNVFYATDNSDLYSYLKELGINIPTKKMVKDPNLLKDLAKTYTQSRLIIYEDGKLNIIKLDANINKDNFLDRTFEQHTIKKSIISIPDSINLEHFKEYSYRYNKMDKSFHFYDDRFNFEHVFDSNFVYSKFYRNISQSTQNYYFKEIANSLKLKTIIKADSTNERDANYYLKLMGQSKTSLIFVNDSFQICNIKYCTNDTKLNDTNTAVSISKITALIKDSDNEPKIIKLFFKLQYGKNTYFDRTMLNFVDSGSINFMRSLNGIRKAFFLENHSQF